MRQSVMSIAAPKAFNSKPRSVKFLRLSHLRRLKKCQQVAAVCYRRRAANIEFLLVQTRGGRWTFPKGSAERGLTHAQAAALEAFEEAGVHGRIEETSFASYARKRESAKSCQEKITVLAHLCEVRRLEPPQEQDRNPTWFSPAQAKQHLREGRRPDDASEMVRVIDRAVARIQRPAPLARVRTTHDPIQKAQAIDGGWQAAQSQRQTQLLRPRLTLITARIAQQTKNAAPGPKGLLLP